MLCKGQWLFLIFLDTLNKWIPISPFYAWSGQGFWFDFLMLWSSGGGELSVRMEAIDLPCSKYTHSLSSRLQSPKLLLCCCCCCNHQTTDTCKWDLVMYRKVGYSQESIYLLQVPVKMRNSHWPQLMQQYFSLWHHLAPKVQKLSWAHYQGTLQPMPLTHHAQMNIWPKKTSVNLHK